MIPTETPTCIISKKNVTHIFAVETFTCISVAETSNCIIATKTVTFMTATKRSTNISVAESTTNIIAIKLQNLQKCNRHCHLHNCHRKWQFHSSNRKLPPAELTTETVTCINGESEIVLVIIKKLSE